MLRTVGVANCRKASTSRASNGTPLFGLHFGPCFHVHAFMCELVACAILCLHEALY